MRSKEKQRGFLLNPFRFGAPSGSGDPFFSNVSVLLHCDPTPNPNEFIDSSSSPKSIFSTGTISTSSPKFGAGCGNIAADQIVRVFGAAPVIGNDDFTLEFFMDPDAAASTPWCPLFQLGADATDGMLGMVRVSNSLPIQLQQDYYDAANGGFQVAAVSGTVPSGAWTHIAVSRQSGVLRVFVDGVLGLEKTGGAGSFLGGGTLTMFNRSFGGNPLRGRFDEVRMTLGVARYTANFTPPSAPFPDF